MQERSVSVYIFRYYIIYNIFSTRVASSCVNSGLWWKKNRNYIHNITHIDSRESHTDSTDTQKNKCFYSGRTTKRVKPPEPLSKKKYFSSKENMDVCLMLSIVYSILFLVSTILIYSALEKKIIGKKIPDMSTYLSQAPSKVLSGFLSESLQEKITVKTCYR